MAGGQIEIINLTKRFDDVVAVDGIDLHIPPGEFFSIVGPSGCGKTTTLRMIGGFEEPTSGRIVLDGVDMQHTPPHKRNVNTVFQAYMIFPHLNVYDNVAFGLRRRRTSKREVKQRVSEVLELVELGRLAQRKPAQLSGGQQQRVALARALILSPSVLLLDEPLGALDAKLRKQLQIQLKALQQRVGITFVYVTHDQEEALTMSDRVAVMNAGHVEQAATPREVYDQPQTRFVADFLGVSNLVHAEAVGREGAGVRLRLGDFEIAARHGVLDDRGLVTCIIRPERIRLEPYESTGENRIPAIVERVVFLGHSVQVSARLAVGQTVQAMVQNTGEAFPYQQGTTVQAHLPADALRVLGADEATPDDPEAARALNGERDGLSADGPPARGSSQPPDEATSAAGPERFTSQARIGDDDV
ncbi:MAG TPA: ABC transporter ATP-binding protein [Solirubrobacteraceae bacterium]|nr:ABC transporter ATP-binding protein [Solirubrobacteraceae bacterium]